MDNEPAGSFDSTTPTQQPPTNPVTPAATPAVPPTPAPAASLPGTPDTWPGAFGIYKYSREAVKVNLATIIILIVAGGVLGSLLQSQLKSIGAVLAYLVDMVLAVALVITYIAGVEREKMPIGQALSESLPLLLKAIGLYILVGLSLILSIVLLIVPFFFVLPRLSLTTYFLVGQKLGVIESYKASWQATKGNVSKVWGIIGVTFLIVLLMITIIGIPFAIYFYIMYSAAMAILYKFLVSKAPATAAPAPSGPAAPTTINPGATPPQTLPPTQ